MSEAKFPAMVSGWATGKDLTAIGRVLKLAEESEDNLGLVLRKEYKDLHDSTVKDFESYTGIKVNSNGDAVIPTGEGRKPSIVMFRHIEQLNNLQNINLGFFWINQGEELSNDNAFQMLKGRLRRNVRRRSGWVTANAGGHNWVWHTWIENKGKDKEFPVWEAKTHVNADVLPADFIASLESLPRNIYKRFVLNDHEIMEGLVWPEFDEKIHTCDSYEIPDDWKSTIGLDHGHDHPTAIEFGAVNWDGKTIIYNEHFEAKKLISYHAQELKKLEPKYESMQRFIDPTCRFKNMQDEGRVYSVLDEYLRYGIHFRTAPMEANAGINKVGELFKSNNIIIFKDKCPNLVRQIKSWKFKTPRSSEAQTVKEEPSRIDEDACKALIYLVTGQLGTPVKPKPQSKDPAMPLAGELIDEEDQGKSGLQKWLD